MSLSTTVVAAGVLGTALLGVSTSGDAAPADPHPATVTRDPVRNPLGWQRYHAEDVSYDAGDVCAFPIRSSVVFDREYVRTEQAFANGSPRVQDYSGPLVVRVTNLRNRRSAVEDLSAYGTFHYTRSGAVTFDAYGPVGVAFHPGDRTPPGYYVLDGFHRVHVSASGVKTVTADRGTEKNVCHQID